MQKNPNFVHCVCDVSGRVRVMLMVALTIVQCVSRTVVTVSVRSMWRVRTVTAVNMVTLDWTLTTLWAVYPVSVLDIPLYVKVPGVTMLWLSILILAQVRNVVCFFQIST